MALLVEMIVFIWSEYLLIGSDLRRQKKRLSIANKALGGQHFIQKKVNIDFPNK